MKTSTRIHHALADGAACGVTDALQDGARRARRLGRLAEHAVHDAANAVRGARRPLADTAGDVGRDTLEYVRKHPLKLVMWFAAGTAVLGTLSRLGQR